MPRFNDVSDFVADGLAFVGSPSSAIHVGDNLVDFSSDRQTVAEVTAHEIGHNLGLSHVNIRNNLFAASGGGTDLTNSQINTILGSSLRHATTLGTLVELDLSGASAEAQADARTVSIGGCGVCAACTG